VVAILKRWTHTLQEGCLERIGENDPEEEQIVRDLWGKRLSGRLL
jgi:hypothetical protein